MILISLIGMWLDIFADRVDCVSTKMHRKSEIYPTTHSQLAHYLVRKIDVTSILIISNAYCQARYCIPNSHRCRVMDATRDLSISAWLHKLPSGVSCVCPTALV